MVIFVIFLQETLSFLPLIPTSSSDARKIATMEENNYFLTELLHNLQIKHANRLAESACISMERSCRWQGRLFLIQLTKNR